LHSVGLRELRLALGVQQLRDGDLRKSRVRRGNEASRRSCLGRSDSACSQCAAEQQRWAN